MPTAKQLKSGSFYGTKSKIPKTGPQKKMWERATEIVMKETGTTDEKKVPWGLVNHIYKLANKAGKVPKKSDVIKARPSKAVKSYKKPNIKKQKSK